MDNKTLLLETKRYAVPYLAKEVELILGKSTEALDASLLTMKTDSLAEDLIKLVLFTGTASKIHLLLGQFTITDISDIYREMKTIEWYNYFTENQTFAVRTVDLGTEIEYEYKSIEKEAGQAIVDQFKEVKNKRIKVRLENPDIEVYLFLIGKEAFIAFDLTGFELNTNEEILARSLILQSNWEPSKEKLAEILSGEVAQSAWNLGKNIPLREKVTRLRYLRTKLLEKETVLKVLRREWSTKKDPSITCYEKPNKMEIVKQKFKEYKKISLKPLDSWQATEEIIISNLSVAEPRKEEQKEVLELILNTLNDSDTWRKVILSIRADIMDIIESKSNINKSIIRNDVNIKGLNSSIIQIEK